ncbi:MAG: permease [Thermoanaerobaculia bacterium]
MSGFLGLVEQTLSLSLQLFARSSGYLLAGLIVAGFFHRFVSGRRRIRRSLSSPGLRSVRAGLMTGVALPICSCGTLPVALELRKQGATPESVAAFLVSTPEDSPDAVFLTAGLFGWGFAIARVVAGLCAAILGAVLVIASAAWGPPDAPSATADAMTPGLDSRRKLPRGWRRMNLWLHLIRRKWVAFRARPQPVAISDVAVEREAPGANKRPATASPLLVKAARALREVSLYGFGELLDAIAWPLLFGFLLSGFLASLLPQDFASRIPGGLFGQFVFAALIAIPLNVCASGTIPLAAVLVAKGLFPAAALVIFLTGPITNPASLLVLRRHFGRKYIRALLISCFSISLAFGLILHGLRRSLTGPGYTGQPLLTENVSGWEILFGVLFGIVFFVSLLRVGWQQGRREIREAVQGLVPETARRGLQSGLHRAETANKVRLIGAGGAVAVLLWMARGFVSVPPGSVAIRETLGRANPFALPAGWHWALPPPLGAFRVVPAEQLLKVDVGFRGKPVADYQGIRWDPFSEYWHSIYTSSDDMPGEASFVAGDQNLVEIKAALHLRVRDPYQLAFRTRDGIDAVRPPFLSVVKSLLATRGIDTSLTEQRGELEETARARLQEELDRSGIPLSVGAVNILDFHPPQETVAAFRDVGSAAEEKERRIFEARGKLDSALPLARAQASTELAAARSDRTETILRAEGEGHSFQLQAAAAAGRLAASRLRLWWNTIERALHGRPKVILPANVEPRIFDWGTPAAPKTDMKGPAPP